MKQFMTKRNYTCFTFLLILSISAIYLKKTDLSISINNIDFSNIGMWFEDKTYFINEAKTYANRLIIFSSILTLLYYYIYKLNKRMSNSSWADLFFLIYFCMNTIIFFISKYDSGDLAPLSILLASLTFLQVDFLNILPIGVIIYIPLLYLFFLRRREIL